MEDSHLDHGQLKELCFDIIDKIKNYFSSVDLSALDIGHKEENKDDRSLITNVDIEISNLVKKELSAFPQINFFSEEDIGQLQAPVVVLDPIDGTREFSHHVTECSVSFSLILDSQCKKHFSFIYNPFNQFLVKNFFKDEFSIDPYIKRAPLYDYRKLHGMASNAEWKAGLYEKFYQDEVIITPIGSIAYKLGLLYSGIIDFVVTKRPKNIWDIAAGTLLNQDVGQYFFDGNNPMTFSLNEKYDPQDYFLWTSNELMKMTFLKKE